MILMIEFLYAIIGIGVLFIVMFTISTLVEEIKWFFLMRKEKKLGKPKVELENYGTENK